MLRTSQRFVEKGISMSDLSISSDSANMVFIVSSLSNVNENPRRLTL